MDRPAVVSVFAIFLAGGERYRLPTSLLDVPERHCDRSSNRERSGTRIGSRRAIETNPPMPAEFHRVSFRTGKTPTSRHRLPGRRPGRSERRRREPAGNNRNGTYRGASPPDYPSKTRATTPDRERTGLTPKRRVPRRPRDIFHRTCLSAESRRPSRRASPLWKRQPSLSLSVRGWRVPEDRVTEP
jgi:hypothetical protein